MTPINFVGGEELPESNAGDDNCDAPEVKMDLTDDLLHMVHTTYSPGHFCYYSFLLGICISGNKVFL